MTRSERRHRANTHVNTRKKNIADRYGDRANEIEEIETGYFRNNNEANRYGWGGCSPKTNRKKGHSKYRATQGAYGPGMNWSAHDKKQIVALDDNLDEYNKGE